MLGDFLGEVAGEIISAPIKIVEGVANGLIDAIEGK